MAGEVLGGANQEQLPPGWSLAELEDIVEVLDGARVPINARDRARRVGKIPYYGATGQVGWIDDHLFDETLILLGEDGAPFFDKTRHVSYVVTGKSWVNNHAHVLRPVTGIDASLLRHQLNIVDYHDFVTGTTRWKLNQAPMRRIRLRIPPAVEQSRIADVLDELFSDIESAEAALEGARAKLKLYRASVLKAAVEGALTADWRALHPHTEPATELLDRILTKRRHTWEENQLKKFKAKGQEPPKNWKAKYPQPATPDTSNLRPLPESWCWATVDQCAFLIQYGTSAKANGDSSGIAVLRMGNLTSDGRLSVSDLKYLPGDHSEFPALLLKSGDLLFNRTNSAELVGKTALYSGIPSPCSFASYLIRVRVLEGLIPAVPMHSLNGGFGRLWIKKVVNQTVGQANVNGTKLAAFTFALPPYVEQDAFVEAVEDQLSVIDHLEADLDTKLKNARSLRQSILRHAFTGRLVPQDPNDEPASDLLKRVAAERKAQVEGGAKRNITKQSQRNSGRPRRKQTTETNA